MGQGAGVKGKIPHLLRDTDRHGNERYYVRIKGRPKTRIREPYGSPAFWAAYTKALESKPPRPSREAGKASFAWLCDEFERSRKFSTYAKSTQEMKRRQLGHLSAQFGALPYRQIEARHIERIVSAKAVTAKHEADKILKLLRPLFKWAVKEGHIKDNPAERIEYANPKTDGASPWTWAEIDRFRARHPVGTKAWLACALLLYTGQRRSDVVMMGRQYLEDGFLEIEQVKTGKAVSIQIIPELWEAIDACPSGNMTFLVTEYGRPFTANGFGNWFRDRCDEAGLKHLSAHGLRKSCATFMAENGASAMQIVSLLGFTLKTAELYVRKADKRKLAQAGASKIVRMK